MEILLIEDNMTIVEGLTYYFKINNLILDSVNTIGAAKEILEKVKPKIIILDVTLPDGDGFNFYQEVIKEKGIATIFLTAKDAEDDVVKGLELGADDYITKPFSNKELLIRVKKVLLRYDKKNIIEINDIKFNMDKMLAIKDDKQIELTALEFKILELLLKNINKVVKRDYIATKIWQWSGNDVNDNTISVYLKRIRDKLGIDIIKTIKGVGYRIDEK